MVATVYILECSNGSFYTGLTKKPLEQRLYEHQSGFYAGYRAKRLPVRLVWQQSFEGIADAIAAERQIKGWSRAKKIALIEGDFAKVSYLSKRKNAKPSS